MAGDESASPRVKKIIKKVHGGHHGGSWKVAYADFVTAMMALFMVLWILSQGPEVKNSVAAYFTDPRGVPVIEPGKGNLGDQGSGPMKGEMALSVGGGAGSGDRFMKPMTDIADEDRQTFTEAVQAIMDRLKTDPDLEPVSDSITVKLTSDGLRIEFGDEGTPFFEAGSAAPRPIMRLVLRNLMPIFRKIPGPIVLEGHTNSESGGLTRTNNWELSAKRGDALRGLLVEQGMDEKRMREIRAYADRAPREGLEPADPRNRRVSILFIPSGSRGLSESQIDRDVFGRPLDPAAHIQPEVESATPLMGNPSPEADAGSE